MVLDSTTIAVICGIAVFLVIFAVIALVDDAQRRKQPGYDPRDWFAKHMNEALYDLCFPGRAPEAAAKAVGIDMAKYNEAVYVAGIDGQLKSIVIMRLYAMIVFVGAAACLFMGSQVAAMVLVLVALYLFQSPMSKLQKEAKNRRAVIEGDLPRFIDLFQTALQIQMPVETAIITTARSVQCELSTEILKNMEQARLQSRSWTTAFEELATKYNIPAFSDFIFNVVIASRKGVDIYEVVKQKAIDVKNAHLANLKISANNANNTITILVMVLKLAPVIAIILYPVLTQISSIM